MNLIIGLTGGIGSGKSEAANYFKTLGIEIIFSDKISKDILSRNKSVINKIQSNFKRSILTSDGKINIDKLRNIVFNNPRALETLENILHPLIEEVTLKKIKNIKSPYSVIEIPLLFEKKKYPFINRTLLISCKKELQIIRVKKRNKFQTGTIKAIIGNQYNNSKRMSLSDDIILNNSSRLLLSTKIKILHDYYIKLSKII